MLNTWHKVLYRSAWILKSDWSECEGYNSYHRSILQHILLQYIIDSVAATHSPGFLQLIFPQ